MIDIVYIERDAHGYPMTGRALKALPKAEQVIIDSWEDVFYRKNQNFRLQKGAQKLILAVNRSGFIRMGSKNCQNFGADSFYYCSPVRNCISGCEYCYLQGMLSSANLLAFVNTGDCFEELRHLLKAENIGKERKMLLPVTYDNDLYTLEKVFGLVGSWADFLAAEKPEGLTVEIRTKCGTKSFAEAAKKAAEYMVFTWSVAPEENIKRFEPRTSPLKSRIDAALHCAGEGQRVRLAFDPLLAVGCDWQKGYDDLCALLAETGLSRKVEAVGVGCFRIPADYLRIMRKNAPESPLAFDRYEYKNGTNGYPDEKQALVTGYVKQKLEECGVPHEKIYSYS